MEVRAFEWDERVVFARVNHVGAQPRLQQLAQSSADVEHQVFFLQTIRTDGAGVVAAVAGINHDLADFQSQGADQRAVPVGGRRSFAGVRVNHWRLALAATGASRKRGQGDRRRGQCERRLGRGLGKLRRIEFSDSDGAIVIIIIRFHHRLLGAHAACGRRLAASFP